MWKCGLKYGWDEMAEKLTKVTSLVEVWIEIHINRHVYPPYAVTSLVEVWIEISAPLPTVFPAAVTSLVEVWIEIEQRTEQQMN